MHKHPSHFKLLFPVHEAHANILALHRLKPCCLCLACKVLRGEEVAQRSVTPPVQVLPQLPIWRHPEQERPAETMGTKLQRVEHLSGCLVTINLAIANQQPM